MSRLFFNRFCSILEVVDIGLNGGITCPPAFPFLFHFGNLRLKFPILPNAAVSQPETVLEGSNQDEQKEDQLVHTRLPRKTSEGALERRFPGIYRLVTEFCLNLEQAVVLSNTIGTAQ